MRRKLREILGNRGGFSLAETLMTVLILLMVTAVVAAGLPSAASAYDKVITGANAQLLLSTTTTRLREELGTATKISVLKAANDDPYPTIIKYTDTDGIRAQIYMNVTDDETKVNDGVYLKQYKSDTETEVRADKRLISEAASNKDRKNESKILHVLYDRVDYNETLGAVTFYNLRVIDGENVLTSLETFTVKVIALS